MGFIRFWHQQATKISLLGGVGATLSETYTDVVGGGWTMLAEVGWVPDAEQCRSSEKNNAYFGSIYQLGNLPFSLEFWGLYESLPLCEAAARLDDGRKSPTCRTNTVGGMPR